MTRLPLRAGPEKLGGCHDSSRENVHLAACLPVLAAWLLQASCRSQLLAGGNLTGGVGGCCLNTVRKQGKWLYPYRSLTPPTWLTWTHSGE